MTTPRLLSLVLLSLGLAAPAAAQDGDTPAAAPATAAAPSAAAPTAAVETAVLAEATSLTRWSEGDAVVAELEAGAEVQVVLRDGEQVRVQHQLDLGWLPASALQADAADE